MCSDIGVSAPPFHTSTRCCVVSVGVASPPACKIFFVTLSERVDKHWRACHGNWSCDAHSITFSAVFISFRFASFSSCFVSTCLLVTSQHQQQLSISFRFVLSELCPVNFDVILVCWLRFDSFRFVLPLFRFHLSPCHLTIMPTTTTEFKHMLHVVLLTLLRIVELKCCTLMWTG